MLIHMSLAFRRKKCEKFIIIVIVINKISLKETGSLPVQITNL